MRAPVFVRPLTGAERSVVEAGLCSSDAFALRRCQILLASARGERPPQIARSLGCASQTARNAIRALNERGMQALRGLLHQSPRNFGKDTGVWTLDLAANVSFERGLVPERVSDETVRLAPGRLSVGWKRARRWIASPDPEYGPKKARATG